MQALAASLQTWSGLMVPNRTATSTVAIGLEPWDGESRKVQLRLRCAEAEEASMLHKLEAEEMNEATLALSQVESSSDKFDSLRQVLLVPSILDSNGTSRYVAAALTEEMETVTARGVKASHALDLECKRESELQGELECLIGRLCSCEQRELDVATAESHMAEQSSAQCSKGLELQEIYAVRAEDVERRCMAQQTVQHRCRDIEASLTLLCEREEAVQRTLEQLWQRRLDELSFAKAESKELLLYQQRAEEGVYLANMEACVVELTHRAIGCEAACSKALQHCAALEIQLREMRPPVAGRWQRRKLSKEARILSPLMCHELDVEEGGQGHVTSQASETIAAEEPREEYRSLHHVLAELESRQVKSLHVATPGPTTAQQKQQPQPLQQQQSGFMIATTDALVAEGRSVGVINGRCSEEQRDIQMSMSMERLMTECSELQAQLPSIERELSIASLELLEMRPPQQVQADPPPPPINHMARTHTASAADESSKLQALFELRIRQLMQADAVNAEEELLSCQERCAVEALQYELEKAETHRCSEMNADTDPQSLLPRHVDAASGSEALGMHDPFLNGTDTLLKRTRTVMQEAVILSDEQQVFLNEVMRERDELQRRLADALNRLDDVF